jgi:hypothetical protein
MAYKLVPTGITNTPMYKIIGGDQKEYGPVTADDLRHWIAEGRLSGQSLVQAEGTSDWKPLTAFPEFADALRGQAGQAPLGGATAPPASIAAWSAEVLGRLPDVQIGRCLGQSWDLLTANFGLLFGATFLVWLITVGCQFIPIIGGVVNWLVYGVLYGGLYLIILKRIRGQPASMGEVFTGFRFGFAQLLLAGFLCKLLATIGLWCCLVLPGIYLGVAWVFSVPLVADKRLEFWSAMEFSRKVVTRVWFETFGLMLVAFLPVILTFIFVQIRISMAVYPIMQDLLTSGPPDFNHLWEVMTQVAKMSIPLALISKFVLLLNLPFALGALMYAYEGLFGPRPAPRA